LDIKELTDAAAPAAPAGVVAPRQRPGPLAQALVSRRLPLSPLGDAAGVRGAVRHAWMRIPSRVLQGSCHGARTIMPSVAA
jgi:hypothetical protein